MGEVRTREYTLELEVDTEPISGQLSVGGGQTLRFTGWLGLASALERLTDSPEERDEQGKPAGD